LIGREDGGWSSEILGGPTYRFDGTFAPRPKAAHYERSLPRGGGD